MEGRHEDLWSHERRIGGDVEGIHSSSLTLEPHQDLTQKQSVRSQRKKRGTRASMTQVMNVDARQEVREEDRKMKHAKKHRNRREEGDA